MPASQLLGNDTNDDCSGTLLKFDNVSKIFPNGFKAVDNLNLEVKRGETLVLLGTSGSGKTTTMKMVNRLIEPTSGKIYLNNEDISICDPIELRRKIGYAIQHIGLFPHMTIAENIAVVPKLLKWSKRQISDRVDELLDLVNLPPKEYRNRYPSQLSGGQKQRVGVIRALATDPSVILMDEPFGALDPITREQLQNEFLELESEIKKTILFVTHDIYEAVKMGDRIVLLDEGKIQQLATPQKLVENPASEFVEQFLGRHRFQLSLYTKKLKHLNIELQDGTPPEKKSDNHLTMRSSLIETMDAFKVNKRKELPVYSSKKILGFLKRSILLDTITEVLHTV
ncbi:MAG: ATP-binding cassette domain-containing protein [Lentisphaerae bacterium]|nr:ATP-binding cassette domain-containing protein [Lentisphaerota bacterium]MCP4101339.1 ATP-binding cassette domain-containing protein [Lentisphaerota bacterium]